MNLYQPAKALWGPVVDASGKLRAYGGQRDFETSRKAMRFVMKDLTGLDHDTAAIQSDERDEHCPIENIEQIYASNEFKKV
ncbi:MAG: hypothetical protein ABSC25_25980 [Roseiarcus sp.]|jgi:hypothetical protein